MKDLITDPPIWCVEEGRGRKEEMLQPNIHLAHICRRRMMGYETMDRHGCVAIAIEVN
jgi:hypothetical protein